MAIAANLPRFGPLRRLSRAARRNLPPINFITLHYLYFLLVTLVSACIFWGISTPHHAVSFTDSLFLVVSAMTLAGLNTVNLSTLNTVQQIMLFVLILIGSAIFVSIFVIHIRKRAFERKFELIVQKARAKATRGRHLSISNTLSRTFSRSTTRPNAWHVPANANIPTNAGLSEGNRPVSAGSAVQSPGSEALNPAREGEQDTRTPERSPQSPEAQLSENADMAQVSGNVRPTSDNPARGTLQWAPLNKPRAPGNNSATEENDHPLHLSRTLTYRSEGGTEIQVNRNEVNMDDHGPPEQFTFGPTIYFRSPDADAPHSERHRFLAMRGVGAHPGASIKPRRGSHSTVRPRRGSHSTVRPEMETRADEKPRKSDSFPNIDQVARNSQFHHLSEVERERLGGYEYRAIQFLSWVVPVYFILWQFLGCLGVGAYVANNKASVARKNGLNPWWLGSFNAVSAFNNSGMSLLDANMVAFQESIYMLITMGLLILAGNTCYPIFLRLIIWTLLKLIPDDEAWEHSRKTLQFLLNHPRRCYTNLFPSQHTYWLVAAVVVLNGIDWAAFELLNINNEAITSLPAGIEVLDGLFQALAVRSGGFYVVPIPSVRISLQVLYVVMMYISVYPVVITIRNTNVYEERSLGIYSDDPGFSTPSLPKNSFFGKLRKTLTNRPFDQTKSYFVRQQLRAQLAHDVWWIVLAVFLIMIIEGPKFHKDPVTFSVFNVIFEVVSAYGCVGISVGLPNEAYSFCGAWQKSSKLILCAVMIRGRHRGLPVAIDKGVMLPGEELHQAEEEDAAIRLERTASRGRMV